MIPERLLIHQVTVINPTPAVDAYGDTQYEYGDGVDLTPGGPLGGAWLQQNRRREVFPEGRDYDDERWLMISRFADVHPKAKVIWTRPETGQLYEFDVDGPPEPAYAGIARQYHHLETTLRENDG